MNGNVKNGGRVAGVVLVLYYHPAADNAPTIREYVNAFASHSRFGVCSWNIAHGLPRKLRGSDFGAIVLHYSLFGRYPFDLPGKFQLFVQQADCPKIALFQDEMHFCQERFSLISDLKVDTVGSLLMDDYHDLYLENTAAKRVLKVLTGYVSDDLLEFSRKSLPQWSERPIDVGYRGRRLAFQYGKGGREKTEIAERFVEFSKGAGLNVDISNDESDRIYGTAWWTFLANCKFALGTMSGASIFDLTGSIADEVREYLKSDKGATFADVSRNVLHRHEGNLPYRAISPRLFEYAALRTAMILYRDSYEGIVEPDVHYIPLEKDFSNIEEVLKKMADRNLVESIISSAYEDLIVSGRYGYSAFVAQIDEEIERLGGEPSKRGESRPLQASRSRVLVVGGAQEVKRYWFGGWRRIKRLVATGDLRSLTRSGAAHRR